MELMVQVTVVEPPHRFGGPVLSFEILALQPPENVVNSSQLLKLLLMLFCVRQEGLVRLGAQVMDTLGALVTVNTAEQLTSGSHDEVTVHVTVTEPPQAGGAEAELLEIAALHPPE